MRYLGVDFGLRRVGLALSDASATLARPFETVPAGGTPENAAAAVAARIVRWVADADEPIAGIVVGLPRRLGGEDTELTEPARRFGRRLGALSGLPIVLQDERLTSHEAEERLKSRERDWRARKARLDAEAAAIILQDYLDRPTAPATDPPRPPR